MNDKTQEYGDLYMGINSPLGNLGDSGLFAGETRGVIPRMTVVQNSPTTAEVDLYVSEPLFLFPFEFATNINETSLCQINTMELTLINTDLRRMWCHDFTNGSAIDDMTVTMREAFVHINYLSPPPSYEIPPLCVVPWDTFQVTSRRIGTLQPGEERKINSLSVELTGVPQQLLLFAKMSNNEKVSDLQHIIGTTDTFAQIRQVSLAYGTYTAILAEAEPVQLYQMCNANGLQDSYNEFYGEVNDRYTAAGTDP
jgi:hypothetical protein